MNRGSSLPRRAASTARSGFNEAPIHESGKFCGTSAAGRIVSGFNEAPIHESGKSACKRAAKASQRSLQ